MPYATKITGTNNTVYDIKDVEARRNRVFKGTCSTAAATAAKVVSVDSDFTLAVGREIAVRFSYTNTANSPTLNVNNTGAKSVYYRENTITTKDQGVVGHEEWYTFFVYDGTNWVWMGQNELGFEIIHMVAADNQQDESQFSITSSSHTVTEVLNLINNGIPVLADVDFNNEGGHCFLYVFGADDRMVVMQNLRVFWVDAPISIALVGIHDANDGDVWVGEYAEIGGSGGGVAFNATNPTLTPTNGIATWTVSHALDTTNVIASVRCSDPFTTWCVSEGLVANEEVKCKIIYTDGLTLTVKINTTTAIQAGSLEIVILGV